MRLRTQVSPTSFWIQTPPIPSQKKIQKHQSSVLHSSVFWICILLLGFKKTNNQLILAGMAQKLRLGELARRAAADSFFTARSKPRLAIQAAANRNWEQQQFLSLLLLPRAASRQQVLFDELRIRITFSPLKASRFPRRRLCPTMEGDFNNFEVHNQAT